MSESEKPSDCKAFSAHLALTPQSMRRRVLSVCTKKQFPDDPEKREYAFILVFILCSWLPYLFIGRVMFMYHYFPTLPFIMLAITAFIKWITEKIKNNSVYLFYVAVVVLMFICFYPVISGMLTNSDYIDSLKWLSSWYF